MWSARTRWRLWIPRWDSRSTAWTLPMRRRVKMAWYSLANTAPRAAWEQTTAPPAETLPRASRSDEDYVRLVAQGEEEALRVLYQRYAGLIFSLAMHKLGAGPAEELVQDVFLT